MKLFYRKIGSGKPVIILHGLYGASDNWMTIAKKISKNNTIILPDLRNHGASPHSDNFSIKVMTEDLFELFDDLKIEKSILIGHSLGGKIVMDFAGLYPEKVEKIIVIDIAPRSYNKSEFEEHQNHKKIINYLKKIDLSKYANRTEALEDLKQIDPSGQLLFFMSKNLKRNNDGSLSWKINIKAIADNLSVLLNEYSVELTKITCPTLFIKGEKSNYLTEDDFNYIISKMKNVYFKIVQGASHLIHLEKRDLLSKILIEFID